MPRTPSKLKEVDNPFYKKQEEIRGETTEIMNLKLVKNQPHSPEVQPHKVIGYPINVEELKQLKTIVFGDVSRKIPLSWLNKGYAINRHCKFGFVQKRGGPCTLLASINAYVFKHLLFSEFESFDCVELVNDSVPRMLPTEDQVYKAFAYALTDILWKCAAESKIVKVAMYSNLSINIANCDGVSEFMEIYEFERHDELIKMKDVSDFIMLNIECFKGNTVKTSSHAILTTLYSAVLSRGLININNDIGGNGPLIDNDELAYGTQSVVNLMLTGVAIIDTFDQFQASELGLKGMQSQSDIGFLTPIDNMVGQCLQSPKYPIWILHYESHYTVMFKSLENSDIYTYYDMLGLKESCWEFIMTNDGKVLTLFDALNDEELNQDTVQLCCLTKWPNLKVEYIE